MRPKKRHTLTRARLNAGLTQDALARQIQVTPITVSRWERGVTTPVGDALARLCEALGCSPVELLERSDAA